MEEGMEKTTFLEEESVGPVPRSPAICSEARHTKEFCWRGSMSPALCGYLLSNLHISVVQPPCNLQSHSSSHGVISTLEQFFPKAPHHGKSPGLRVRWFQFELRLCYFRIQNLGFATYSFWTSVLLICNMGTKIPSGLASQDIYKDVNKCSI